MLKEFVLISLIKPGVRKTLNNILFSRSLQFSELKASAPYPNEAAHGFLQACYKDKFILNLMSNPFSASSGSIRFAIQTCLAQAYHAGIGKGIWTTVQFSDFGTVPIRTNTTSTVNSQLEIHRPCI